MNTLSRRVFLPLMMVVFASMALYGQPSAAGSMQKDGWSVDLAGGVPITQFTVSTDVNNSVEYGLALRYSFSPELALRIEGHRGLYNGSNTGLYNRSYRTKFYHAGVKAEYTLLRSDAASLAMLAGVDGFNSEVNAITPGGTPTQYQGQNASTFDLGVGFGALLRFKLSDHLDFFLQAERHILDTRSFDGFSREITSGGQTYEQPTSDRLVTASAGLTIKFGKNKRTHQLWHVQDPSDEIARLNSLVDKVESRLSDHKETTDKLAVRVANLKDSLNAFSERHGQLKSKHRRMMDSLQSRLTRLQNGTVQKEKKKRESSGKYYIIAASFDNRNNANKYTKGLIDRGITGARIIPPTSDSNFYKVSYISGQSQEKAQRILRDRFKNINSAAWLMEYDGKVMNVD